VIAERQVLRAGRVREYVCVPSEVPVREDDRRVTTDVRLEPGGDGLLTLVGGAVGTQRAEGDGVSAALGRKVALMRKAA
jgi:hypothetical protein